MLDEYSVYYNDNVRKGVAKGYSVAQLRDFALNAASAEINKGTDPKNVYDTLDKVWGIRQTDTHADITNAKALATAAFINQQTGAAMPDTAPTKEITPDTGLLETLGEGAQRSIPGLANKLIAGDKAPANLGENSTFAQKVAYGTGQFMGDYLPMMVAAKALSPLLAGGAPGVAAYGLSLAAVGFTTGASRQWLMDQLRLGKAENVDEAMQRFNAIADVHMDGGTEKTPLTGDDFVKFNEFADRIKRAGKAGLSEAFVFGSMGAAGAALKKALFANLPAAMANLTPVQQFFSLSGRGAAAFSGEMAAMTGAQAGVSAAKAYGSDQYWETLKAELPTLSDVLVNAVTIGGFKMAGVTASRMSDFYVTHGIPPNGFKTLVSNKPGFAFEALSDTWHGRTPKGRQGFRATGDERVYFDSAQATTVNDALMKERADLLIAEKKLRGAVSDMEARTDVPPEKLADMREKLEVARQQRIAADSGLPEDNSSTPARGVETVMVPNTRVIDVPLDSTGVADVVVNKFIEKTSPTGVPKDPVALGEWKDNMLRQPTSEFKQFLKETSWTEEEVTSLLGKKAENYNLANVVRNEDGTLDWTWRGLTYGDSFIPLNETDVLPMKVAQSIKGLTDVAKVQLEKLATDMKVAAKEAGTNITDAEILNNAKILRGMAISAQQLYGIDAETYLSKYKFTGMHVDTMSELGTTPGIYKQIDSAYRNVPWVSERLDMAAEMKKNGKAAAEIEKKTGYTVDKEGNAVIRDRIDVKDIDETALRQLPEGNPKAYVYLEDVYKNARLYDTFPELKLVKVKNGTTAEVIVQGVQRAVNKLQGRPIGEVEGYVEYYPAKIKPVATPPDIAVSEAVGQPENIKGGSVTSTEGGTTGLKGMLDIRNGRRWVTLFETADSSTVVNQFGHAFVADLLRQARYGDIKAADDLGILSRAAGIKDVTAKGATRQLHDYVTEQLWEPYFTNNMNAGAATGIMARMKVGLHNLYEQTKGMKGGIPFEIAKVFDRATVPVSEIGIEGTLKSFKAGINFSPGKRGIRQLLTDSYKIWFDKFDALNKGATDGYNTDSYIESRTAIASGDKAQMWMQRATYDYATKQRNGESLTAILRDAGNMNDVSTYLTALNTIGRFNAGKTVILDIDAARMVATHFESNPAMPAIAERLRMYNTRLLQYAHDAGVISPETLAEHANTPFLPLETLSKAVESGLISRRELSEMMGEKSSKEAKAAAVEKVVAEEAKQRKVEDPILSLAASTVGIMKAADVNVAKRAIAKDWGFSEATPSDTNPEYATVKGKSDRLRKITFLEDGKAKSTYVQKDIYDAAKGLDGDFQPMFADAARFLTLPARFLRAGAVLDPGFILRNLSRDQITAGIQSKAGYKIGVDMLRGMGAILNHKTGGKMFGRYDEIYERWVNAGGGSASQISGDYNILDSTLTEMLSLKPVNLVKDPKRYARGVLHLLNPLNALRNASEAIEVSSRLGEFMRAREQGYTDRDAAFCSREVTLDFARAGIYGKVVNSYTPFFNASLQGVDKEFRQLKQNPIRFGLAHLSYVVIPAFMAALAEQNMIQNSPNSQGAQKAQETPEWQKAMFIHLYTGKDYKYQIALPTLHGLKAMMTYSVRKFVEYAHQQEGAQWFNEYLHGMGIVTSNQIVDVFPQVLKVPYETMSNYNMFTGNKIVSAAMANLMPELQYRPSTTMPARKLAEFFDKVGNGMGLPIPAQLASPVHVEHIIQGITGTLGMNVMRILDMGMRDPKLKVASDWTEFPMVKSFFVRYPSYSAKSIETFNRDAHEMQKKFATINKLNKSNNPADRERAAELASSGDYATMSRYTTAMSKLSTMINGIYNNVQMTADEKRQAIDNTLVQMIQTARSGKIYIKSIKERANARR